MSERADSGSGLSAERAREQARDYLDSAIASYDLNAFSVVAGLLLDLSRLRADRDNLSVIAREHAEANQRLRADQDALREALELIGSPRYIGNRDATKALVREVLAAVSGAATGSDQRGRQPE